MMRIDRLSRSNRAKIRAEIMVRRQMRSGEIFLEMERGGKILRLGCETKVEIGHNPDERTIVHQAEKRIFRKLRRL
jgi:hypothetical protein